MEANFKKVVKSLLIVSVVFLSGCDKDFDENPSESSENVLPDNYQVKTYTRL